MKSAVSQGTEFMCEKLESHTEHGDDYCMNVGEQVLVDITPRPNRSPWNETLVQQLGTTVSPHVPV